MAAPRAEWTPERRRILDGALRKVQAADLQGERLLFAGDEARIMARAAENWRDMMVMLDQRAREVAAERWIKGGPAPDDDRDDERLREEEENMRIHGLREEDIP